MQSSINIPARTSCGLSLICFALFFSSCNRSSQSKPAILADVGGKIHVVICSAASARKSSLRNADLVSNIVNGLPPSTRVLILVNDRSAFRAAANNRHVTFLEIPDAETLSIWPQDPFVVLANQQTTQLLVPKRFDRENDSKMAEALSTELQLTLIHSELDFEGGNVVVDKEAVCIGYDTIQQNALALKTEHSDIQSRFAREMNRPVVIVGNESQAIAHIDMIITPLGERKIAVADSRLGAQIVNKELLDNPNAIIGFERRCEKEFFGRGEIDRVELNGGGSIERPDVVGRTQPAVHNSEQLASALDSIADHLASLGYEIVRIPTLIPDQTNYVDENGNAAPQYPFLTFNNVLIEQLPGEDPVVYLPQYGLTCLDAAAIASWEKLGFEVRPIGGFAISAMYCGSLRCCTKVLTRQE